jgi:uncharacterized protein
MKKTDLFLQELNNKPLANSLNGSARKRIWLNVTEKCNQACIYCSAFCDKNINMKDMSFLVAKKSIENALKEFGTNQLHICFFGGEPLCNFDLIKKVVKYYRYINKNITYSVSTNALIINSTHLKYFKKNNFFVQVSIDGSPDIQKKQRPYISGYEKEFSNYEKNVKFLIKKMGAENVVARATITSNNIYLSGLFDYLLQLGFKKIHFDPNISRGHDELDLGRYLGVLKKEINSLVNKYYINYKNNKIISLKPISTYHDILTGKAQVNKCEAGINRFCYDVNGKKFPCHMVVGLPGAEINEAVKIRNKSCDHCLYHNVCGGKCLGEICYNKKDIKVHCAINQMYINALINNLF